MKRGQVTLFIILGALLVIALILVVVFREKIALSQILPERIFPTKTSAVERFIDGCIEAVGTEGLTLLGAQGGYIELPQEIAQDRLATIDTGIKIPYWHYNGDNRIPSLLVMESQLSRYMNENLKTCLDNLAEFQQQYTIIEKGGVFTSTFAQDTDVVFSVEYPIEVQDKEGKKITELKDFRVEVALLLKQMAEVATSIMLKEAQDMKFERLTIDLLSLDPEIPTSGTSLQCSRERWQMSEIRDKLLTLLRKNLPAVRVDYTTYTPIADDQPYVQNHYVWKATEFQYDDIAASFTVVEQPFRFDVRPRSGNTLQSNQLKGQELASFVCLQQWNFVYDVEYPVLVSVEDTQHNFVLNFGFTVRVKNNRGARVPTPNEVVAFEPVEGDETKFCDNTYASNTVRVFTLDNVSDPTLGESYEPIDGVDVSFTCIRYTCDVGVSKYSDGGARSSIGNLLPSCVNGVLKATKPGYKPAQQFVTPEAGLEVSMYLTPLKLVNNYRVVKHTEQNGVLLPGRALDNNEKAFVSLRYKNNQSVMHETWGTYPAVQQEPLEMLAGATFPITVEVYIMKENKMTGAFIGAWTAEWSELEGVKTIEFHTLAADSDDALFAVLGKYATDPRLQPVIR